MDAILLRFLPAGLLYCALILAVLCDFKSRKIPNKIVYFGALLAIALHSSLPAGKGFFTSPPGGLGFLYALSGLCIGFILFFPFYITRVMGAGDVKLVAMVGAFFGPNAVISIVLLTLLAGGVLAVVAALWNRSLIQAIRNIYQISIQQLLGSIVGTRPAIGSSYLVTGKLPYAVAIAGGTALHLFFSNMHFWPNFQFFD